MRAWLVVLVAVCVVPFLVLFFVRAGDARTQARDAVSADTLRLSRIAAQESATVLDEVRLALTALRTTAMPGASDPCTIVGDVVAQVADTTPFALDANGAPRCGSDVVAGLAPDDPALAAARKDGFAFARLGPPPGTTLVGLVSLPAPGDVAFAGARIELGSALSGLGQQLGLPDDATVFLVDSAGATIAAGTPRVPPAGAAGTELVEQVAAGAVEGTFDESASSPASGGVGRIVSYADVGEPGVGLYAVLGLPTATAFASADRQLRANLVVTFIVALVALAAAGTVAELCVRRPFRRLLRTVRRLGAGELGARSGMAAESPTTEINELAHAIDHMATNLEERDENVRAMAEERQRLLGQIVEAHE